MKYGENRFTDEVSTRGHRDALKIVLALSRISHSACVAEGA